MGAHLPPQACVHKHTQREGKQVESKPLAVLLRGGLTNAAHRGCLAWSLASGRAGQTPCLAPS